MARNSRLHFWDHHQVVVPNSGTFATQRFTLLPGRSLPILSDENWFGARTNLRTAERGYFVNSETEPVENKQQRVPTFQMILFIHFKKHKPKTKKLPMASYDPKIADKLLAKKGFNPDGTPKGKETGKQQQFFERRIIKTPMGNQMR